MKINLCTDPALVDGWCLRLSTRRYDRFVWWSRRLRYLRLVREEQW